MPTRQRTAWREHFRATPRTRCLRAHRARRSEACGYSALLVHSGSPLDVFEDDRTYPFEAHAPFKVWVPLTDAPDCFVYFEPGQRPRLLFSPARRTTGTSPPTLPQDYWTRISTSAPSPDRAAARGAPAAGPVPAPPTSAMRFPELAAWGVGAINPQPLMRRLDYVAGREDALRAGVPARGQPPGRARPPSPPRDAFARRRLGVRDRAGVPARLRPARAGTSLQPHHRAERRRLPCCTTRCWRSSRRRQRHSLLIDAGREFAGYASDITRTYSAARRRLRRADRAHGPACSRRCARGCAPGSTGATCTCGRIELTAEVLREADIIRCGAEEAVEHGRHQRVPAARHRPPARARGARRRRLHAQRRRAATSRGPHGHPFLRLTRVLEAGFVVTMEPGIYFIDQLLEAARADQRGRATSTGRGSTQLRKFGGIRIEDDLAVHRGGCENLTRDAFAHAGAEL